MKRRYFGTLAWIVLLLVVGIGRLLWTLLRWVVVDVRRLLLLGSIALVLYITPATTAYLADVWAGPLGHMVRTWG